MKTSRLSLIILLFLSLPRAFAFSEFDCLRDMLPVTSHGAFQTSRTGVEPPFMLDDTHMIFPAVEKGLVAGFYVYTREGAWYYDAVSADGKSARPIASLNQKDKVLYQMVVQPTGLETVTIYYMPGFNARATNADGPVMLGASVLPVVGALVSRPEKADYLYQNPGSVSEKELKEWVYRNMTGRRPASAEALKLMRKIVKLSTLEEKETSELFSPLRNELRLREKWIEDKNLDDETFRNLGRVMRTTCNRKVSL